MKSLLLIDQHNGDLAQNVQSLAEILHIPFDHVTRKNDVRRIVATGNVGMIIANSSLSSIRFDDLAMELDTIQKRNRIDEFPIYYICSDTPKADENLPQEVSSAYLIKKSTSLERIYDLIVHTLLSDLEIEQSGGFINYSTAHKEYIASYERVLSDLKRIVQKTLNQ